MSSFDLVNFLNQLLLLLLMLCDSLLNLALHNSFKFLNKRRVKLGLNERVIDSLDI